MANSISRVASLTLLLLLLAVLCAADDEVRPQSIGPATSGSAPECPHNAGTREFHSAIAKFANTEAFILATSRSDGHKCEKMIELHIRLQGKESVYTFPPGTDEADVIDFSSDGSTLLLSCGASVESSTGPAWRLRVAEMPVSGGEPKWRNPADLPTWKDCDAMLQVLGFSDTGKIVVLQSSVGEFHPPHCVPHPILYALDSGSNTTALPATTKVKRYAETIGGDSQTCRSDPDLVGACFTIHGRLSYSNGGPGTRIWWVGTHRMLGVDNEVVPEEIARQMDWDHNAFGDYTVCPESKQEPGVMQSVCIDSVKNVVIRPRDTER